MSVNASNRISGGFLRIAFLITSLVSVGCQGSISRKPPIHIIPNMDFQEKFEAQEENDFFADSRAMRPPVAGTVARGFLKEDDAFYRGRDTSGELVTEIPVEITKALMERGRDRFEVYCAVCHGSAGDGNGIIMTGKYGYVQAPNFHTDALRAAPAGHFFSAISNGIRSMPNYATQVPVADRWAIVAYIRALQRSQNAGTVDVPDNQR